MQSLSCRTIDRAREWAQARDLTLIGYALLLGLLTLVSAQIADLVRDAPLSIDQRILLSLRDPVDRSEPLGGSSFQSMVRDVTALGSGTLTGLFAFALLGYLFLTGRPWAALFVGVAVLGSWGLNEGLKDWFARERPTIVPHLMTATEPSFPSGHTMISATLYPTLAELFGRLLTRRRARVYLMGLAIGLAGLVGFTRVYLGVHYPTDVVAGLCLGLGWALLCGIVARWLQKRHLMDQAPRDEEWEPVTG
jgi:undecaprenyl-diphosphatase